MGYAWARLRRMACLVLLLMVVSGCSMFAPRSGAGALFLTPEEALADAVGQDGWLDHGITRPVFHHVRAAPEGTIALYSGYAGGRLVLGSADAKPEGRLWHAHGMFRLAVPEHSAVGLLSCTLMRYESSGASVVAVTGRISSPTVQNVDIALDASTAERAAMRDGVFMFLDTQPVRAGELRALGQDGAVIERVPLDACASERS